MTTARLLIIDDHETVREALEAQLGTTAGLEVIGCTGSWRAGLRETEKLKPDIVLLEIKRGDGPGFEALRCLTERCPCTSVIVLNSYPDANEQNEARRMGAARYLLKDIDTPQLVREIQACVRPNAMI